MGPRVRAWGRGHGTEDEGMGPRVRAWDGCDGFWGEGVSCGGCVRVLVGA